MLTTLGLNYAMQCVGSIMVAPLIKRFPTKTVLSCAILAFGLISAILLVVDAATGGTMAYKTANGKTHYGSKCILLACLTFTNRLSQAGILRVCSQSTLSQAFPMALSSSFVVSFPVISSEATSLL